MKEEAASNSPSVHPAITNIISAYIKRHNPTLLERHHLALELPKLVNERITYQQEAREIHENTLDKSVLELVDNLSQRIQTVAQSIRINGVTEAESIQQLAHETTTPLRRIQTEINGRRRTLSLPSFHIYHFLTQTPLEVRNSETFQDELIKIAQLYTANPTTSLKEARKILLQSLWELRECKITIYPENEVKTRRKPQNGFRTERKNITSAVSDDVPMQVRFLEAESPSINVRYPPQQTIKAQLQEKTWILDKLRATLSIDEVIFELTQREVALYELLIRSKGTVSYKQMDKVLHLGENKDDKIRRLKETISRKTKVSSANNSLSIGAVRNPEVTNTEFPLLEINGYTVKLDISQRTFQVQQITFPLGVTQSVIMAYFLSKIITTKTGRISRQELTGVFPSEASKNIRTLAAQVSVLRKVFSEKFGPTLDILDDTTSFEYILKIN